MSAITPREMHDMTEQIVQTAQDQPQEQQQAKLSKSPAFRNPEEAPLLQRKKKKKVVIALGTRKKAIARAVIREGKGRIRINSVPIELVQPRYKQMRIKEAVMLAQTLAQGVDIDVTVSGGGIWGQADAVRTAIANALVSFYKDNKLKQTYLDYDRTLLISDARRTEPHKPSRSSAGPRRTKQQSKR